jgi:hypothetical protein
MRTCSMQHTCSVLSRKPEHARPAKCTSVHAECLSLDLRCECTRSRRGGVRNGEFGDKYFAICEMMFILIGIFESSC